MIFETQYNVGDTIYIFIEKYTTCEACGGSDGKRKIKIVKRKIVSISIQYNRIIYWFIGDKGRAETDVFNDLQTAQKAKEDLLKNTELYTK